MNVLDAAIAYCKRGWSPIPVPYQSKNPGYDDWQLTRLKEEDLPSWFPQPRTNIGILVGEPSRWLVDVDLDHMRCVELADQFLPPTPAVFGRPGKPRSHRIYYLTSPAPTKKHKSKSAGMLVEFRSTGGQTVFPPSTHESGEPIAWETEGAEPASIDSQILLEAVAKLANAVREELGERASLKKKATKSAGGTRKGANKFERCVAAMLRLKMEDHKDGSGRLHAAACRIVEFDLSDVDGIAAIRDYARQKPFPGEWSDEDILKRIRDAEKKTERGIIRRAPAADGKRTIVIDTDEHRVVNETIVALKADDAIFQRGGILTRVLRDTSPDDGIKRCREAATISPLPIACLRERMTHVAEFTTFKQRGDAVVEVATHPTSWLVGAVDARGEWEGIRHLNGISDVPILRPDGTLWQTPGYDTKTGVIFEPSIQFPPIPEDVALSDARAAVAELEEVVCDFHFETEDHRAAWYAGLLTPLARHAFGGPSPLFLIDANVRGAGKSLLAQTIGEIVLGHDIPVSSYSHDTEEMRKKVTSIMLAGDRMVNLDNLDGKFGNDVLDRVLTATRWKDRIMGTNQLVDLPLHAVWYGTGNNVAVASDTSRRIIHIRLDVLEERPEERTGFRHPHLINWIRANRARLLTRALTILVAYCRAGLPSQTLMPYGTYESWSSLVRGAIVWAGLADPCRTRTGLVESSDTTADALAQLIRAWKQYDPSNAGVVIADILPNLYPAQGQPSDDASLAMRAALENITASSPGKPPGVRLIGTKLRAFRRRVVGKCYLDTTPGRSSKGMVWRLFGSDLN